MVRNGSPSVTPRDTIHKVVEWVIRCIEAPALVVVRRLMEHGARIENAGFIVTLQIVLDCTISSAKNYKLVRIVKQVYSILEIEIFF